MELIHGIKGGAGNSATLLFFNLHSDRNSKGGGGLRCVEHVNLRDFYWFRMPAILPLTVFSTVVETVFSICPLT